MATNKQNPATALPITVPAFADAANETPFSPDLPLKGRYVIGERLGQRLVNGVEESTGAIGLVYCASDKDNFNQLFVLKTLRAEYLNHAYARQQFDKEREALARLNGNDDIVRLVDKGEENGRPYIIVEFIRGRMLSDLLAEGPIEFTRAANLLRRIARALHKAHQAGVFHRDLKPDNIMVIQQPGEPEIIKLLDFGLAKIKNSFVAKSGLLGTMVGTPQYAAPEQLQETENAKLNAGMDIYALGVVAYELLTGQRPFQAGDIKEMRRVKASAAFRLPQELRSDLPPLAQTSIVTALAPDAADRYTSILDFGNILADALEAPATPLTRPVVTHPPVRRGGWLLALILLLVMAAGLVGLWRFWPAPPPAPVTREVLEYSLTLQPMKNNAPAGAEFKTAESEKLSSGWNYNLSVTNRQAGAIYLIAEKGADAVRVFFPVKQNAQLAAGSQVASGWRVFGGEKIWLLWATQPVSALENATRNSAGGVPDVQQAAAILQFLKAHRAANRATPAGGPALVSGTGDALAYQLP